MSPPVVSLWYGALLLCLPGVYLLGYLLAVVVVPGRLAPWLGLLLGGAPWLLLLHVLGRLTHSFRAALVAASLICAAAGLLLWRRRGAPKLPRWPQDLGWMLGSGALTAALVGRVAWTSNFHDEVGMVGHLATTVQLVGDVYPPRFLPFPALEFSYHYGVNILAAALSIVLRLRPEVTLDMVTVGAWFHCWCLLWTLGVVGCRDRRAGPLFASLFLLGGGFFAVCSDAHSQPVPLGGHLAPICSEGGLWLNPSMFSYFFQHPWSVGLPLFLALASLTQGQRSGALAPRCLAYFLLLAALVLCQVALAALALPAVLVAEAWSPARGRLRRSVAVGATLAAALLVMMPLGAFFAADDRGSSLEPHLGILDTDMLDKHLSWYARSLGLLLPFGLAGALLTRQGAFVPVVVLLGLLIVNLVRYRLSWDIVKFLTVAQGGLALLAAEAQVWALSGARSLLVRVVAVVAVIGLLSQSVILLGALVIPLDGLPSTYSRDATAMEESEVRAVAWMTPRLRPGCIVWVPPGREFSFAHQAPLPQVWVGGAELFPIKKQRLKSRQELIENTPRAIEPYLAEGVQFLLTSAPEGLTGKAEQWVAKGAARRSWSEGQLVVFELLGARCAHR